MVSPSRHAPAAEIPCAQARCSSRRDRRTGAARAACGSLAPRSSRRTARQSRCRTPPDDSAHPGEVVVVLFAGERVEPQMFQPRGGFDDVQCRATGPGCGLPSLVVVYRGSLIGISLRRPGGEDQRSTATAIRWQTLANALRERGSRSARDAASMPPRRPGSRLYKPAR